MVRLLSVRYPRSCPITLDPLPERDDARTPGSMAGHEFLMADPGPFFLRASPFLRGARGTCDLSREFRAQWDFQMDLHRAIRRDLALHDAAASEKDRISLLSRHSWWDRPRQQSGCRSVGIDDGRPFRHEASLSRVVRCGGGAAGSDHRQETGTLIHPI